MGYWVSSFYQTYSKFVKWHSRDNKNSSQFLRENKLLNFFKSWYILQRLFFLSVIRKLEISQKFYHSDSALWSFCDICNYAVAPKFSNTLTLSPPSQRLHLKFLHGYVPADNYVKKQTKTIWRNLWTFPYGTRFR